MCTKLITVLNVNVSGLGLWDGNIDDVEDIYIFSRSDMWVLQYYYRSSL